MNEQEKDELFEYYKSELESGIANGLDVNEAHEKAMSGCQELYPDLRQRKEYVKGEWRTIFNGIVGVFHKMHLTAMKKPTKKNQSNNSKLNKDNNKNKSVLSIMKEIAKSGRIPHEDYLGFAIWPRKASSVRVAVHKMREEGYEIGEKDDHGWPVHGYPPEPKPEPKQKHITPINPEGISEEIKKKLKEAPLEMLLRNVDDLIDDIFDSLRK